MVSLGSYRKVSKWCHEFEREFGKQEELGRARGRNNGNTAWIQYEILKKLVENQTNKAKVLGLRGISCSL